MKREGGREVAETGEERMVRGRGQKKRGAAPRSFSGRTANPHHSPPAARGNPASGARRKRKAAG